MKKHVKKVADSTKVRFAAIGVINTAIDFGFLNLFAHAFGVPRIPANIMSASIAMCFSFFMNRTVVFNGRSGDARRQAVLFVLVTLTSAYLIQNVIIYFFTDLWTWPLTTTHDIIGLLDEEVFITNGAKAAATLGSLVWNYIFYNRVVFKHVQTK